MRDFELTLEYLGELTSDVSWSLSPQGAAWINRILMEVLPEGQKYKSFREACKVIDYFWTLWPERAR